MPESANPTVWDLDVLNDARDVSEQLIDKLCELSGSIFFFEFTLTDKWK
jgi:hypothetical protein